MRSRGMELHHSRLEVIVGPMFSGKTAELVRRVDLASIAHQETQVFRPRTDTRQPGEVVFSRNGMQTPARVVGDTAEIARSISDSAELVAIDEAQFLDEGLPDLVRFLVATGRRVIVAGLDIDFAARPFGPIPTLLALADTVDKLTAVCTVCHSLYATRTQRLVGGEPATEDSPQVVIDAGQGVLTEVRYEARCLACYQPPPSRVQQLSYWASDR